MMIKKFKEIIEKEFPKFITPNYIISNSLFFDKDEIKLFGNNIKLRKNIFVVSIGKVAYLFAKEIFNSLNLENPKKVKIITDIKYLVDNEYGFDIFYSTHPYLSYQSIENTKKMIDFFIENDSEDTTFIFLISGGGSSLFEYPLINPNLAIEIYKYILLQNLNIHQINTIRRFFSSVKSGKIFQYIKKSQVISLIFSDVPFNDLSSISSGITFLKKITSDDIFFVSEILKPLIDHYNIHQTLRKNFEIYEDIEKNNANLDQVFHFVLADNNFALRKLYELFVANEMNARLISSHINLSLNDLLSLIKSIIITNIDFSNTLFLLGGETNLKVIKEGFGGRLQHLCLSVLKELKEIKIQKEVIFFAFATDGVDGNTNRAGSVISNQINVEVEKIKKYLDNFNSGLFFENPKNQKYSISFPAGINNLNELYGIFISDISIL